MLLVFLGISIAIILFAILKLKWDASLALVLGSIFMGVASGLTYLETASAIGSGFGSLMTGIGLPIGFGVILGQLLSDSGGAQKIANTMVDKASEKYALYALALTALILSIPVFFDVVFVILIPLGISISRRARKPLPYTIGAMAIGGMAGHTFVPPTPNPLAAAEILSFDLGVMVIVGGVVGAVAVILACKILFTMLDKGFWNKEKDETGTVTIEEIEEVENAPSFAMSLVPILLPVITILLSTVIGAVTGEVPEIIQFLGNKTIALFIGVISAYIIAGKSMTKEEKQSSATKALEASGIVLLITGAGGSFGRVITEAGISDYLAESLNTLSSAPILAILVAAGLGFLFRLALGSGTVASITAMTIMSAVAPTIGIHPVWIALACLSGSIAIGHVNDSGYWVVTNLSGFSVTGGMKIYTFGGFLIGAIGIISAILGALVIPI